MNDLDNEIRRAFDELVNAAPPPPTAPSPVIPFHTDGNPRHPRLLAVAASILIVAVIATFAFTRQNGTRGISTVNRTDPPGTPEPAATPTPVPTEPLLIREDTGGSPDPVVSFELVPIEEYEAFTSPAMPGSTEPVPAPGAAYDGVYFAYLHEGPTPDDPLALRFDTVQAFSGKDCIERFGSDAATVCAPFGIDVDGSTGQVDVVVEGVEGVEVTVRDVNSDGSYRISGAELLANVFGRPLAASAPQGYVFSGGFGFLLTFDNGVITRIDQPGDPQPAVEPSGWSNATEPFPELTYIACCGTDWTGLPSPEVPADPTEPLAAGTYNIRQVETDEPLDGILSLEVRAYVRCNDLVDRGSCVTGEPYADDTLGVSPEPDRVIDLDLNLERDRDRDRVNVAVWSSICLDEQLVNDNWVGRGSDLAALFSELDVAYRRAVIDQLDAGVSPSDIEASIAADSGPGFYNPGCPAWSPYWWEPAAGPTVITPFVTRGAPSAIGETRTSGKPFSPPHSSSTSKAR